MVGSAWMSVRVRRGRAFHGVGASAACRQSDDRLVVAQKDEGLADVVLVGGLDAVLHQRLIVGGD